MPNFQEKTNADLVEACVLLGLTPPFTAEQAKVRYRELAKLYHPDAGIVKNSSRFAQISSAYDLLEANARRLSTVKLSLSSQSSAATSQVAELLEQLHEARAAAILAEKNLKNQSDEIIALRKFLRENRGGTLKRVTAFVLFCGAALFLGFLAGMIWSAQPPIVPLQSPDNFIVSASNEITTSTILQTSDQYPPTVDMTLKAGGRYKVTLSSASIALSKNGAQLRTSPTLEIVEMPQIELQPQYPYPAVAAPTVPNPAFPAQPQNTPLQ